MADRSKIEWCDASWNPITGCGPADYSESCSRCYARRMATRLRGRYGYPKDDPFKVTVHNDRFSKPLRWKKPRRVFVCSMGDLFHEDVPVSIIDMVFGVIAVCESHEVLGGHVFQVLTKRPERMREYFSAPTSRSRWAALGADMMEDADSVFDAILYSKGPLANLWLGITAENQARADERIPILLDTPAAVRFVSVEPMLGAVDVASFLIECAACDREGAIGGYDVTPAEYHTHGRACLSWVICGAETGPGARPMEICAATHLRDACIEAEVPFFFKRDSNGSRLLDGREWNEYPEIQP